MTRNQKLFLNSIMGVFSQMISIVCGLILPAAILTAYGSSANGLTNSIGQFLGFIQLCELGVGAVVQSALYKPLADGDTYCVSCILKSSKKFFQIIGMILLAYVIVLCVVYPRLITEYEFAFVCLMIIVISINSFANYYLGMNNSLLLQADQKAYIPLGSQAIAVILNTIVCLLLIRFGATLLVVKMSTAVIYLIRPVVMWLYVKRNYSIDYTVTYVEEPIKQKWNGLAQHFASVIVDHTDIVVLTVFATLADVSIYAVYYMVVSSIRSMINSSLSGVQAVMGNMISRKEIDTLKNFFNKTEWALHTVVVLLYSVTGVLIVPFILIYTKSVADANYNVPFFAILIVIANAGFCLQSIYKLIVKAAGHYKETQLAAVIEAVINVVSSVILVSKVGLTGVAMGTILAMAYRLIYHIWYIKKNIIYRPYSLSCKQFLVDILTVCVIVAVTWMIPVNKVEFKMWILSAIVVTLISIMVAVCVNFIFFRGYMLVLLKTMVHVAKRKCKR